MSLSLVIVVVLGNITQNEDDGPKLLDGRGRSRNLRKPFNTIATHVRNGKNNDYDCNRPQALLRQWRGELKSL